MPHVQSAARANATRLLAVLGLSLSVLAIEIVGGLVSHSLALLADAAHVFTDAAGISLALLAIWIGSRPANTRRTFGYLRLEILAAASNAILLFGVAVFILYEAWRRLSGPPHVTSTLMLGVALVGLLINGIALWLLRHAQARSLNARAAYLEVLGDLAIAVLILPRTWGLLHDATDVLLEATPKGVSMDEVRAHILDAPGVADVHDLHAWTITSGMNVVSAHVVLEPGAEGAAVLESLCDCLAGHFDIEHSTFQLEFPDRRRLEGSAHG